MAPPRLIFIFISILTLTLFLTFVSLTRSHSRHYTAAGTATSTEPSSFRSLFSFRTPSALFPSSAIISLTDDNSTFFLSRPADFGPSLPSDGLSAQLWVGSGFGDDNLGRGLAADSEGELGCSDVPGWRNGRKHHQGDGQFEPSTHLALEKSPILHKAELSDVSVQDPTQGRNDHREIPSEDDGTDDHLHHPLPPSRVSKPSAPGRAADADRSRGIESPQHADIQSLQESAEISGKLVLLSRGGCGFLEKVKWAQRRGAVGLIVGDNTRGGALVTMYARGDTSNVTIPALFTSRTTAHLLSSLIPPESPDDEETIAENLGTENLNGANVKPGDDRPTFTPMASLPRPTSSVPAKASEARLEDDVTMRNHQHASNKGWFRSFFGMKAKPRTESAGGATEDSRRPPSSDRLTWINEQWTESAITSAKDKTKAIRKDTQAGESSQDGSSANLESRDGFEIGVHDWRDPDLVGMQAVKSSTSTVSSTSNEIPRPTGVNHNDRFGFDSAKELSGGSITPGSGEYEKPRIGSPPHNALLGAPASIQGGQKQTQSWLAKSLWRSRSGQAGTPYLSKDHMSSRVNEGSSSDGPVGHEDHEGLWVTLTPTTVSTSPFFDTLLVLVVSPLITLTVVYSLLLIRSRIRRRRWRAPKSVVERLPIRTYHTMSCSSTTSSSQLATPLTSSPTSPLLQSSPRSVTSRTRPRSHTASGVGDAVAESLDKATTRASMKQRETSSKMASSAQKRQYHGKQVECVVCLEEYVDGQSKVMSLPCGHEFHAECM